ncbi:MAG: glutamyl-tRNA reductase [Flavisolibacter sp.]
MDHRNNKDISKFFVAGINYKKSDASLRGQYAVSKEQYERVLKMSATLGLDEIVILSTCNRTEIYGFASDWQQLIELLCSETIGDAERFRVSAYNKKGIDAINHAFYVGAGLDSQILGDYEIVGQLKNAVKISKEYGFLGSFTERLFNYVLQSSKLIKNNTKLSGGTVSVSFAAVQYIKRTIANPSSKNILLLGLGKIGINTCKNLIDYLGTKNITLINRSYEKAYALANDLGLKSATIDMLSEEIKKADIILTATSSSTPIILNKDVKGEREKLIIDLSIPYNVDSETGKLSNVQLVNIDELSKLKDETLKMRLEEVPKAKSIIAELVAEFEIWSEMRRHAPLLNDLKLKLKDLCVQYRLTEAIRSRNLDARIQRIVNLTAGKLKGEKLGGCLYISALNDLITSEVR